MKTQEGLDTSWVQELGGCSRSVHNNLDIVTLITIFPFWVTKLHIDLGLGWFLHSSLELGMFLRHYFDYFFIKFIDKQIKALHKLCLQQFNIGLNKETNYEAGLKQGFDLRFRS